MSRHIGIVAVSPEGAALFYQALHRAAGRMLPPSEEPRISMHNEPLNLYIDAIRKDDWHAVGRLLRRSADYLARCGAEFVLSPDNVVAHGIHLAEVGSPIPWLHMIELVGETIQRDGKKTVGVIGTKLVTSASTYQTMLGLKGIHVLPPEPREADTLDQIIYGELIYGQSRPESRLTVLHIIDNLAQRGCEGVILACSEAPLLVTQENSPLPVYDSSAILAEGAVRRAIG
jgi:aspartate racemase